MRRSATDMTLKMRERPELFNVWLDMTPMGRIGEPSEIAGRHSVDRRQLHRLVNIQ